MKKYIKMLLVWSLLLCMSKVAFAQQDYSADMVATGDSETITGKLFATKDKARTEMPQSISITRFDKNVVWILMPNEKMYIEQPLKAEDKAPITEKMPGEIERQLIGAEVVDGKATNKYKVSFTVDGKQQAVFQWITPDLNFPVKTQAVDGSWSTEFKNLNFGKQPDSLFEIPEGYNKFSYDIPPQPGMEKEQ